MTFAARVRAWRKQAGFDQFDLDDKIAKKRGFINHLENGAIKPPEKQVCFAIGAALGVDGEVVWGAAKAERLRGFDADLYEEYALRERGEEIGPDLEDLVALVRWLGGQRPGEGEAGIARMMWALMLTLTETRGPERSMSAAGRELLDAAGAYLDLPSEKREEIQRLLAMQVRLARPHGHMLEPARTRRRSK